MHGRWISLGGWCGPSQVLAKRGYTNSSNQLPFDSVRCTLDGIAEFTKVGFDDYFPPVSPTTGRFEPDPVSIWLLFRGQHTCFTHYDLNREENKDFLRERISRWHDLCENNQQQQQPITFLRTSISEDPLAEMKFIPQLQKVFDEKSNNKLDYRIVLVHHVEKSSSEVTTKPIHIINDRAVMWQLKHDESVDENASLFDKSESGYDQIIDFENSGEEYLLNDINNKDILKRLNKSQLLSRVEGVSTFLGTCTGFGSTQSAALGGVCLSCGDRSGHQLKSKDMFDTKREWTQEEDDRMLSMVMLMQDPEHGSFLDVVALVEKTANDLGRGANEVLERFREFGMEV